MPYAYETGSRLAIFTVCTVLKKKSKRYKFRQKYIFVHLYYIPVFMYISLFVEHSKDTVDINV